MILLNIKRFLNQVDELDLPELTYPYVYSDKAMMKLFLYALVHHLNSFASLQRHLEERPDVLRLVGLCFSPAQNHPRQALQANA